MMLTRNETEQNDVTATVSVTASPQPVPAEPLPFVFTDTLPPGAEPEPLLLDDIDSDNMGFIEPCVIFPDNEEINQLYQELDEIFGTPKMELTEEEQAEVDALYDKVDAIFAPDENGEWTDLTEAQEAELDSLFAQIDSIYGIVSYDSLSAEQQQRVDDIYVRLDELWEQEIDIFPIEPINEEAQALYDRLDEIFGTYKQELTEEEQAQVDALNTQIEAILAPDENGKWPELTDEQEEQLNSLYKQIDAVHGVVAYEDLSEAQQAEVDSIYASLDALWADPRDEEAQPLYDRLDEIFGTYKQALTEEEQAQVDALNTQIEAMLSPDENGVWPELTEEQWNELDGLYKQIDKVYGVVAYEDLSETQQQEVDDIFDQLDDIYMRDGDSDGLVTIMPVFDENTQALFDELDSIFGTPKSELTEEEQSQVDSLYDQVDAIYGPDENGEWKEPTEAQEVELTALYKQIDAIYGVVSYDDLTEEQQKRVDEIYDELSAEPLIAEEPSDTGWELIDPEPFDFSDQDSGSKSGNTSDDKIDWTFYDINFPDQDSGADSKSGNQANDSGWITAGSGDWLGGETVPVSLNEVSSQEVSSDLPELIGNSDFDYGWFL